MEEKCCKCGDVLFEKGLENDPFGSMTIVHGTEPYLRGHWAGRLAAIDADLADMEKAQTRESQDQFRW